MFLIDFVLPRVLHGSSRMYLIHELLIRGGDSYLTGKDRCIPHVSKKTVFFLGHCR